MNGSNLVGNVGRTSGRSLFVLLAAGLLCSVSPGEGAERKFSVYLANSPKEFPGTTSVTGGVLYQPTQGLVSFTEVHKRYFGPITGFECFSEVGDFATFWDEITYGDVTVNGQSFDWLSLPWAIQPPLRDPEEDVPAEAVEGVDQCGNEIWVRDLEGRDNLELRNSPECYIDLQDPRPNSGDGNEDDPVLQNCPINGGDSRLYGYGEGESFDQNEAVVIVDADGDPFGDDNGPFQPAPGLIDTTADYVDISGAGWADDPGSDNDVFTPSERFLDIDEDGRWDGSDESSNMMDFDGDGLVDYPGPWVDLDGSDQPNNQDIMDICADPGEPFCDFMDDVEPRYMSCTVRLDDDGLPDPNFGLPCDSDADCGGVSGSCINTVPWRKLDDLGNFDGVPDCAEDSNGDPLIPVPVFSCPSTLTFPFNDCNGNLVPDDVDIASGTSEDVINWECAMPTDDICEGEDIPCVLSDSEDGCCCWEEGDPPNTADEDCSCDGDSVPDECQTVMTQDEYDELPSRCEFFDANCDELMDIAEPFEDFLRRWDACREDTDSADSNDQHWVKIYDPRSPTVISCDGNAPPEMKDPVFAYNDPSYIYSNYPGNTDALVARAGNGIFDAGDSWTERGNTKMQWQGGPRFFTATPKPGTWPDPEAGGIPWDEPWYEQAWEDRYHVYTDIPTKTYPDYSDPAAVVPIFPTGDQDPQPPTNNPALMNTPAIEIFRLRPAPPPGEQEDEDPLQFRRYFAPNRGGLNGDGTGWVSGGSTPIGGPDDIFAKFETEPDEDGDVAGALTIVDCDTCPVLPEELDGIDEPTMYFDGWVEHDDLPSSKYHIPVQSFPFGTGDQALGEVTSPTCPLAEECATTGIAGHDKGDHDPNTPDLGPDNFTVAAGPYAYNVHGSKGRDGGNVLLLEWLTWRTDGRFPSYGLGWEWNYGPGHPFAGPGGSVPNMNFGFRDYNLDGLIDQGEVRPQGSENYVVDIDQGTPNDGTNSLYPFNRRRLLEDCVAALDYEIDFDLWIDANVMNYVTGGSPPAIDALWAFLTGVDAEQFAEGFVSGIVMLPPGSGGPAGSAGGDTFPIAPSWYPIHNEDGDNRYGGQLSYNLWFHDLVSFIEYTPDGPSRTANGNDFIEPYSAHEWGHSWEGWPDLYDYDIFGGGGALINYPVGHFCLMTNQGRLVHPIAPFKESSSFIDPVDLATVLTPGVPQEVTIPDCADFRDETYYFFENPDNLGERFYFYHEETKFNEPKFYFADDPDGDEDFLSWIQGMPGPGMLVLYADLGDNPESFPPQQISGNRATYKIFAADGLEEGVSGVNQGDAADPWPGTSDNSGPWNDDSFPNSRWDIARVSGIEFNSINPVSGGSRVEFVWNPTDVPSLQFLTPPGGVSVDGIYQARYKANDTHGGTTIEVYYTTDPEDYTSGTLITTKDKPIGSIEDSVDWDVTQLDDDVYYLFAKLIPGVGEDGESERAFSAVRAGRNNFGDGTLSVISVDSDTVKLESWTVEAIEVDVNNNAVWQVEGSLSGIQIDDDVVSGQSFRSDDNEVTFILTEGPTKFAVGDRFVFVTTGLTAPSAGVAVTDGQIDEAPHAVIRVLDDFLPAGVDIIPAGPAPLTLYFDAQESTDPNGFPLTYTWNFGDGTSDASGPSVVHEFTDNGSFTVTLTARNSVNDAFDEAQVDVEVINQTPTASFIATPTSGSDKSMTVTFDASGSSDPENESDELIYEWNFGDCPDPGCTAGTGVPGAFQQTSHFYSTNLSVETFNASLTVTDSGGATDTLTVEIMLGNSNPVAKISAEPTQVEVNEPVTFSSALSTDPDADDLPFEAANLQWAFGDGAIGTGESITHAYTTEGTYTAILTVLDGRGGEDTDEIDIRVVPDGTKPDDGPNAGFSVTPGTVVDIGEIVTFTSTSTPADEIVSLDWDFDDGSTGSGELVTHVFAAAGIYSVSLTAEDGAGLTDIATQTITVIEEEDPVDPADDNLFDPLASIVATPVVGFAPLTVEFDASNSSDQDGDELSYSWDFGDGTLDATGAEVDHTFTTAGAFTVTLTADDGRGRSDQATRVITVSTSTTTGQPPLARIATGRRSGPAPLTISFDGNLSSGDSLSFEWIVTGTSGAATGVTETLTGSVVSYTFAQTGTYTVMLEVTDMRGDTSATAPQTVTVTQATTPIPDDGEGNPIVDRPDTGGSSGRPSSLCGAGMVMSLLASLAGFAANLAARSRRVRRMS